MPKSTAVTGLEDVLAYIGIIALFFLFLKKLLQYAKETIEKEDFFTNEDDDFYKKYGYTYEYVFVFPVFDESEKADDKERQFSVNNVYQRLKNAQLDVRCFYSCQRDEVYIKVRAAPDRLKQEASRINYRLLLNSERLKSKLTVGKKKNGEWIWRPIIITDFYQISSFNPYEHIYASYDDNAANEGLYKEYAAYNECKHIFKSVDRINLIISIMQSKINESPPGAELNILSLVDSKIILAAFPIHDFEELKTLQLKWLSLFAPPWQQPIDDIKNYFGERIGLYFYYIQHYVESLMIPAILGAVTFIVQKVIGGDEVTMMPFFASFIVCWTSYYTAKWAQKQSIIAMKWGMTGVEDVEQDRPLYKGVQVPSPIDGRMMRYFSAEKKFRRVSFAMSVTATLICCVIAIVSGIYYFQYWINQPARQGMMTFMGVDFVRIVASIMNAVVIVVLNNTYQRIAIILNNYENHRTDTQYEDYLISKIFLFQLVNSFAGLTYVSFIKFFLDLRCNNTTCTGDVAASLSTIFISSLVTRAITGIFIRKFLQDAKLRRETSGLPPNVHAGPIELQFILDEYHVITGTLMDYAGLVIQYGYTVLFVAAFPLSPTIAFVSSFIQIRIDGWKLCQAFRRPQPKTAEDIGVWEDMIQILSSLAVIYNLGLVFLTGGYLKNYSWYARWVIFIGAEHLAFLIKYGISSLIDKVPEDVDMQLDRQEYFVKKVIRDMEDEKEDVFEETPGNIDFFIQDYDNDWVDLDGNQEDPLKKSI